MKIPDPQAPVLSAFLVETDEITENTEGDPDAPEPAAEETRLPMNLQQCRPCLINRHLSSAMGAELKEFCCTK